MIGKMTRTAAARVRRGTSGSSGTSWETSPGKATLTDGLTGSYAASPAVQASSALGLRDTVTRVTELYNEIRAGLGALKKATQIDGPDLAKELDAKFREAERLVAAQDGVRDHEGNHVELENVKQALQDLYAHAVPHMRRHGVGVQTGLPGIDRGFRCVETDRDACFLSPDERAEVRQQLSDVVHSAMANYRDALHNRRLEEAMKRKPGWGFWEEFLFHLASGPVIVTFLKGFKMAKALASKLDEASYVRKAFGFVSEDTAKATLGNLARGVRKEIQHWGDGDLTGDQKTTMALTKMLQDQIKPFADGLLQNARATMTDAEMVASVHAYGGPAHTIDAYREVIDGFLDRYGAQQLGKIGTEAEGGGVHRMVILEAYGHRRMAVLEDTGTGRIGPQPGFDPDGPRAPKPMDVRGSGANYLRSLIDDDLAPLAASLNGGDGEVIRISEGDYPFSFRRDDIVSGVVKAQIDRWVTQCKAAPKNTGPTITPIPQPTITPLPADGDE